MPSRICPRCGRNDVRLSSRHSAVDRMMACIGLAAYRCRVCRKRFFRFPAGNGHAERSPVELSRQTDAAIPVTAVAVADRPTSRPASAEREHPLAQIPIARSLLIVSRDAAIRRLLGKLLTRPGYHTHELADAAQLSSELQARKVDVLITDLDLPEQQGLETLATLRDQYPNLKVIALSTLRVGGVPGPIVLQKPFRREALIESVQNALIEAAHERQPVV